MRIFFAKTLICSFLLAASALLVSAQTPANTLKGKYTTVEVEKLEVARDVDIPPNQITVIWLEIIDELQKIKNLTIS